MTVVAIMLAMAGACCYAVAAWMQHAAVRTATDGDGFQFRSMLRLIRAPRWVGGLALTGAAAALHASALGLSSLIVVQPIGVVAIALTTVLSARSARTPPSAPTMLAVASSTLGVGLFVALAAGSQTTTALPRSAEAQAAVLGLCFVMVFGALAGLSRGRARCVAFASGAGVAYGLVSVLIHTTARHLATGGIGEIRVTAVIGIVAALLVGGWFVQHAYSSGPPHLVVACLTVVDPLLGVGVGAGLLNEGAGITPFAAAGQVGCAALAIAGVVVLAQQQHHPARRNDNQRPQELPVTPPLPAHPLRIVIGADTFPPDINGAARFAGRLASGLAGRGHDVHVLCPSTDARASTEISGEVTVHRVPSRRTPFHPTFRVCAPWRAYRAAAELLDELAPDLVHVQAHFLVGRGLARTAVRRGIPLIATNHFMPENLFGHGRIPGWLQSTAARLAWRDLFRVYRGVEVITAPTPKAVQLLQDNGLTQRAIPISCGIDIEQFRPRAGGHVNDRGSASVLFVGRLDKEKRVDELLRATALLTDDIRIRLDIVGDGSCRTEWETLAVELGIGERVRFHGFVNDAELIDRYARSDVFCMPGIAELQSLATMEAMAAGKPVVAADAMALPHLVHPGQNGWLYPPGDVPALANRLHRIFTEPNALARMGGASRRIIADHAIDRSLDSFESLYLEMLGRCAPSIQADAAIAI
jgi:glycosyltransferase involved in cell wall biosynthesis